MKKLIIIISRSSLKLGQVGPKFGLLDEIVEKPCEHSRGHSFNPKFMKLCHNLNHQILDKTCVHSRGQSCDPKFRKFCQNINPHNI